MGDGHQERGYVQLGECAGQLTAGGAPKLSGSALAAAVPWVSLLNPTCKGRSALSATGVEDTALTTALVGQYGQTNASPNPERSPCARAAGQWGALRPPFLPCQSQGQPLPQEAVETFFLLALGAM